MVSKLVIRIFGGFGVGAVVTLLALVLFNDNGDTVSAHLIALNLLGSMLIGGYFSVSALLFEIEEWSMLKQTLIHYTLSLIVLFPVFTLLTGWVPLNPHSLLIGLLFFTGTYVINWLGWFTYFKQMEKRMNASLKQRN
ncbi:DUF3021 domain-containing protein [Chryseomicrobium palamuruense]|uniref:DUF3021 domain-containing protein n=1 Tax=Chryseomicrobium palamuruense TaxID=682973 RepID=A0ABV8UW97_9BACL